MASHGVNGVNGGKKGRFTVDSPVWNALTAEQQRVLRFPVATG